VVTGDCALLRRRSPLLESCCLLKPCQPLMPRISISCALTANEALHGEAEQLGVSTALTFGFTGTPKVPGVSK